MLDSDQDLYKNFPLVISERWQQEVAETVYEAVNSDTDKNEARKRAKNKQQGHEEGTSRRQRRRRSNRPLKAKTDAPRGSRVCSLTGTLTECNAHHADIRQGRQIEEIRTGIGNF